MAEHLVFTLCASMASMGELAGHERRGTLTWPGRSAILGLVGAALGVRRGDAAGFAALDALKTAVGVIDDGAPLRDYHTVQTVPTTAARRPDSRPEAMRIAGPRRLNTTITLRDYRVGVAYAVALWGGPLKPIQAALKRPAFTLYLGRKSCPLAAPPQPLIVPDLGLVEALGQAARPPFLDAAASILLIASDEPIDPSDAVDYRHDLAVDRDRRHFAVRPVRLHRPGRTGAVSSDEGIAG